MFKKTVATEANPSGRVNFKIKIICTVQDQHVVRIVKLTVDTARHDTDTADKCPWIKRVGN